MAVADRPFENGQPSPRSAFRLAAFPFAARIADRGRQRHVPLALNNGGKLLVRLRRVVIRPAKPVFEFVGCDNAAIGEAIDFERGRPSVRQIRNYSNFRIPKREARALQAIYRQSAADVRSSEVDLLLELSDQVEIASDLGGMTIDRTNKCRAEH